MNSGPLRCMILLLSVLASDGVFADSASVAEEILASRESMVGRAFAPGLAVYDSLLENKSDAEKQFGKKSLQAADSMILVGHATRYDWYQMPLFNDALDIVEQQLGVDHPLYGRYLFEAAAGLIDQGNERGKKYLARAEKWHQTHSPPGSIEMAQLAGYRGRLEELTVVNFNARKAGDYYTQAAALATAVQPATERSVDVAMAAHGEALRVYESAKMRDAATPHVVALAQLSAQDGNGMPQQLYFVPPQYPRKLLRKKIPGRVVFELTVDEEGFVSNPTITDSDGADAFGTALLKVIESWRFSPRIKNGQPVTARIRNYFEFSAEDGSEE